MLWYSEDDPDPYLGDPYVATGDRDEAFDALGNALVALFRHPGELDRSHNLADRTQDLAGEHLTGPARQLDQEPELAGLRLVAVQGLLEVGLHVVLLGCLPAIFASTAHPSQHSDRGPGARMRSSWHASWSTQAPRCSCRTGRT